VITRAIESPRLLVVSRDAVVLRPLWSIGEANHWQLECTANAWEAMERVQSGMTPDLLLLDLPLGDTDGLYILRWLRRLRPELPILLLSHPDDAGKQQEAFRLGAREYLVKPVDESELEAVIRHHLVTSDETDEANITSDDVELMSYGAFFIGTTPIMRKLRARAALLAEANVPVLILGESGSGKETTARLIHKLSARSGFEFATVNCAALASDLLERELFGCRKDGGMAPTGFKSGKLELCAKGTLLLVEITEMPLGIQANLLQVLQKKQFTRPGTSIPVEVDVRVLAASTRDMEHAVSQKRLREDLYYLLSAYTIHVPPLRERKDELLLLSRHLMLQLAKDYSLSPRDFSPAVVEACRAYSWPGNLRELEDFVKRYLMASDQERALDNSRPGQGDLLQNVAPIKREARLSSLIRPRAGANGSDSLRSLVQSVKLEAERNAIAAALEKTGWNRKAAAELLEISYRTLLYKIEQYQMRSSNPSLSLGSNAFRRKRNGIPRNGSD
jgi:two-component system, NtrC family, response regulator AtoC